MRNHLSRESAAFHHLLLHIILQSQGKGNTAHLIVKWFSLCKPNSRFSYYAFPITAECLHSLCLHKEIFQSKSRFQSSWVWSKLPWNSFSLWGEWFLICHAAFWGELARCPGWAPTCFSCFCSLNLTSPFQLDPSFFIIFHPALLGSFALLCWPQLTRDCWCDLYIQPARCFWHHLGQKWSMNTWFFLETLRTQPLSLNLVLHFSISSAYFSWNLSLHTDHVPLPLIKQLSFPASDHRAVSKFCVCKRAQFSLLKHFLNISAMHIFIPDIIPLNMTLEKSTSV